MKMYAEAAYPSGGSDCAQSAREALLAAAQSMQDSYDDGLSRALLNRRQRAVTKAAIHYYMETLSQEGGYLPSSRIACLLQVLSGDHVDDADYEVAEARDRAHD